MITIVIFPNNSLLFRDDDNYTIMDNDGLPKMLYSFEEVKEVFGVTDRRDGSLDSPKVFFRDDFRIIAWHNRGKRQGGKRDFSTAQGKKGIRKQIQDCYNLV